MKLINFFINNKRQIVLGLFAFVIFLSFSITFSDLFNEPPPLPKQKAEVVPDLYEFTKSTGSDYRALKLRALDSLIDHNIFTVENIAKIDSLYPDSICHCGDQFLDTLKSKGMK